jgi:hypothetical protein
MAHDVWAIGKGLAEANHFGHITGSTNNHAYLNSRSDSLVFRCNGSALTVAEPEVRFSDPVTFGEHYVGYMLQTAKFPTRHTISPFRHFQLRGELFVARSEASVIYVVQLLNVINSQFG